VPQVKKKQLEARLAKRRLAMEKKLAKAKELVSATAA